MGDSVLTEILARHQRGALPEYFNTFFQTVTFTNGGMVYDLINKRLSQTLLNSWMGPFFSSISCRLDGTNFGEKVGTRQLGSVWSPSYQNEEKKKLDIANMDSLNKYKNGKCLFHKSISYLSDRARYPILHRYYSNKTMPYTPSHTLDLNPVGWRVSPS